MKNPYSPRKLELGNGQDISMFTGVSGITLLYSDEFELVWHTLQPSDILRTICFLLDVFESTQTRSTPTFPIKKVSKSDKKAKK